MKTKSREIFLTIRNKNVEANREKKKKKKTRIPILVKVIKYQAIYSQESHLPSLCNYLIRLMSTAHTHKHTYTDRVRVCVCVCDAVIFVEIEANTRIYRQAYDSGDNVRLWTRARPSLYRLVFFSFCSLPFFV